MAKGFPIFSTVVLRTTKEDPTTPMTVMYEPPASFSCKESRKTKHGQWVKHQDHFRCRIPCR